MVDFGVDDMGKRQRRFFEKEDEADDAIDDYEKELKKFGEYWLRMKPAKRRLVAGILTDMDAKGQSIDGVWADWQRWQKDNAQTMTIPMPYEDVVTEWKRRKLSACKAALRAMSDTREAQLFPDLLKLAGGAEQKKFRVLAIRACVRLATREEGVKLSNADKVATLKTILDTPLDAPEKRVDLAGLSDIPDDKALALATPLPEDDAVRSEAAQAVIHIAGSISTARPASAGAALKKVLAMQINPATRKSAETAFKKIP